jgi:toxin FitB
MPRSHSARRLLLDTCVLAELQKPVANPDVIRAIEAVDDSVLFLSVLTIAGIRKGIDKLAPGKRRSRLDDWLIGLVERYGDRILPIDLAVAELWGRMNARLEAAGSPVPAIDGLIAATALRHGLVVVTRNPRHFAATGAAVLNPFVDHD